MNIPTQTQLQNTSVSNTDKPGINSEAVNQPLSSKSGNENGK